MKRLCFYVLMISFIGATHENHALELSSKQPEKERKLQDAEQKHEFDQKTLQTSIPWGVSSIRGKRHSMEDEHVAEVISKHTHFYGVFDGHGGKEAAVFIAKFLPAYVMEHFPKRLEAMRSVLHDGFMEGHKLLRPHLEKIIPGTLEDVDNDYYDINRNWKNVGSTAVVAVLGNKKLFVAHAGDTRAVLCSDGQVAFSSTDHKISNPAEYERLVKAGALFSRDRTSIWKAGSLIAVSRSLGDYDHEGIVIPDPEIESIELSDKNEFLILACDGVWDKLSNEQAVKIVRQFLAEHPGDFNGAATFLQKSAFAAGSGDNITAMVIDVASYFKNYCEEEASRTPRESAARIQ